MEPFIYLALLLLFILLSYVTRWLKGAIEEKSEEQRTEDKGYVAPSVPTEYGEFSVPPFSEGIPPYERRQAERLGRISQEPLRGGRVRKSRLGGLKEVRGGIVLMTILGPCRALEPQNDFRRF